METPLIEFRDVSKSFGDKVVLDHINLSIYENQITTIIGKSGTGKSVLLKHIIGLLKPDEGTILYQGRPTDLMSSSEWDECRSHISYMFQNNALFDSMTVFDNVALPLRQKTSFPKKKIQDLVMQRLAQTELADAWTKYPSELSGGMQKRVALARALVTDPKVVLFDEPTTGQDPIRRNAILSMIANYRKRFGFTAVLISHDIPDVFFISDRIVLLWEGRAAFQGTYEEMSRLDHPMIEEFLKSLEGFQDELTGLLSKQTFRSRYITTLGRGQQDSGMTAALFSVEVERLAEELGHSVAAEIVKSLGEYISNHLDALGGFSTRQRRDQILTIMPYANPEEAETMINDFAMGLEQRGLPMFIRRAQKRFRVPACFEIKVYAGVANAHSNDVIDSIIAKAKADERVIARFRCD